MIAFCVLHNLLEQVFRSPGIWNQEKRCVDLHCCVRCEYGANDDVYVRQASRPRSTVPSSGAAAEIRAVRGHGDTAPHAASLRGGSEVRGYRGQFY